MRPLLQFVLILGLGFLAQLFLPFWGIALVAVLVSLFFRYRNSLVSFVVGFLAAGLLWGGKAALLDSGNQTVLSGQLGELFGLSGDYLVWATAWLGGLLGGLGAMTGTLAGKLFLKSGREKERAA